MDKNLVRYAQDLLVINLYQLFDLIPQFQEEQTRTLTDVLDEYIEPFNKTTKEWLKVFIAIENNPNDDEIEGYYNEELSLVAIEPFLEMTIETINKEGYSRLESYRLLQDLLE